MGVAGAGKSTLAAALAGALGLAFVEADAFHTPEAQARMAAGQALTDAGRAPWLAAVAEAFHSPPEGAVLACSALRAAYRARLAPTVTVFLSITPDAARARLASRAGHFAGPALVASQFAGLEPPADAVTLDAQHPPARLIAEALAALG
jgi:gluconokinase